MQILGFAHYFEDPENKEKRVLALIIDNKIENLYSFADSYSY